MQILLDRNKSFQELTTRKKSFLAALSILEDIEEAIKKFDGKRIDINFIKALRKLRPKQFLISFGKEELYGKWYLSMIIQAMSYDLNFFDYAIRLASVRELTRLENGCDVIDYDKFKFKLNMFRNDIKCKLRVIDYTLLEFDSAIRKAKAIEEEKNKEIKNLFVGFWYHARPKFIETKTNNLIIEVEE